MMNKFKDQLVTSHAELDSLRIRRQAKSAELRRLRDTFKVRSR